MVKLVLCDTDEEMAKISDEYAPRALREYKQKNLECGSQQIEKLWFFYLLERKRQLHMETSVQEQIMACLHKGSSEDTQEVYLWANLVKH